MVKRISEEKNINLIDAGLHVERDSGIELLKIIAIFIIILAHMAQGLSADSNSEFYLNLNQASLSFNNILLNIIRCGGGAWQ